MQKLVSPESNVYLSDDFKADLTEILKSLPHTKLFLLTDDFAYKHLLPTIESAIEIPKNHIHQIKHTDHHKDIESLTSVWQFLADNGADRKSILINLGGGMPCDLGGFAASTFKRGIRFINIPTTLLAQVDASVGGKTGINFNGFKNEIGVFQHATAVLVNINLIASLDLKNIKSGYAEMIKHALINTEDCFEKIANFNLEAYGTKEFNTNELKDLVWESIQIKERFVQQDPKEQGIRKALNLGHTVGHAFESMALKQNKDLLHGYAVAFGVIVELYLSHIYCKFPFKLVEETRRLIDNMYGSFAFTPADYETLYEYMTHDKKNEGDKINFTLLKSIGNIQIDQNCSKEDIFMALNYYLKVV